MCGCSFSWHLAFKTWIPNTHQNMTISFKRLWKIEQHILSIPLSDVLLHFCYHDRSKRDVSAIQLSYKWLHFCLTFSLQIWIPNKHQFWQSALIDMKDQTRNLGHKICQMCGCTFSWHLAFKTWIPNTINYDNQL